METREMNLKEARDLENSALNLDFPNPDEDVDDIELLDETFEEENLPDDPFLSEYERGLMDYEKEQEAQAEIDRIRAEEEADEEDSKLEESATENITALKNKYGAKLQKKDR